ncbi:MAG: hypothetical protein ABI895_37010, partial [Deltaproteobacteria bacterium]
MAASALFAIVRRLGLRKALLLGAVLGVVYFLLPTSLEHSVLAALTGGEASAPAASSGGSVCQVSAGNGQACDFSRAVLASTEDVWA